MELTRKEAIGYSLAAAFGMVSSGCRTASPGGESPSYGGRTFAFDHNTACVFHPMVKETVKFTVISDAHFAFIDERDDAWREYAKRAMQWPGKEKDLDAAFAAAKKHGAEFIPMTGDMFTFPSFANIEFLDRKMKNCGFECLYIAGNHDWHYEGVPGTDCEQRAKWIADRMTGLYRGRDPMAYSVVRHGIRCLFVDDSTYIITPEQLEFLRTELAKGDPTCLFMHIPIFMRPKSSIYTLANPAWGEATDKIWQIERRLPWRKEGPPAEAFAFRELVFSSPNMVAVFTGHEHFLQVGCARGVPQFLVPCNYGKGLYMNVTVSGCEGHT